MGHINNIEATILSAFFRRCLAIDDSSTSGSLYKASKLTYFLTRIDTELIVTKRAKNSKFTTTM